ncbi:VirB3 family type IV secretion system protein [Ahrensia sp. 13_GOM-1096m]|uniref:VirB3 family type IV secretion system protein n=1 Tax=Ahrensia sp. 13_GOM-1096m TaxID=1380380 RepID=UPI00047E6E9D|nr:VirB3 family type IV secretion system protein [Ahrensia sp. 13_GOM-1096m]
MATPLFKGLTRPVSLMGLPMTYFIILMFVVVGGFIATLSLIYFGVSAIVGYIALRILAAFDPRIFDVIFTVLRVTPLTASWLKGKGVIYGA